MEDICAWERNKRFFGTAQQPDQISKILDMLKEQDIALDELQEQISKLTEILVEEEPEKPKKK